MRLDAQVEDGITNRGQMSYNKIIFALSSVRRYLAPYDIVTEGEVACYGDHGEPRLTSQGQALPRANICTYTVMQQKNFQYADIRVGAHLAAKECEHEAKAELNGYVPRQQQQQQQQYHACCRCKSRAAMHT